MHLKRQHLEFPKYCPGKEGILWVRVCIQAQISVVLHVARTDTLLQEHSSRVVIRREEKTSMMYCW